VEEGHIALERLKPECLILDDPHNIGVEEGHIALERLKLRSKCSLPGRSFLWKKATSRLSD